MSYMRDLAAFTDAEITAERERRQCASEGHPVPSYRRVVLSSSGDELETACICGATTWVRKDRPMAQLIAVTATLTGRAKLTFATVPPPGKQPTVCNTFTTYGKNEEHRITGLYVD